MEFKNTLRRWMISKMVDLEPGDTEILEMLPCEQDDVLFVADVLILTGDWVSDADVDLAHRNEVQKKYPTQYDFHCIGYVSAVASRHEPLYLRVCNSGDKPKIVNLTLIGCTALAKNECELLSHRERKLAERMSKNNC